MPLINHLLDERELIASIEELKKVYTQVQFAKVSKDKNLVSKIQSLIQRGKLTGTSIDEQNSTLRFEDLEVQQSSLHQE